MATLQARRRLCYVIFVLMDLKKGELKTVKKIEHNFISTGFRNWKKAVDKFKAHQSSQCHTVAKEDSIRHSNDIVELTNKNASHLLREERKYLIKIMETIKFHARQGISFQSRKMSYYPSFGIIIHYRPSFIYCLPFNTLRNITIPAWYGLRVYKSSMLWLRGI